MNEPLCAQCGHAVSYHEQGASFDIEHWPCDYEHACNCPDFIPGQTETLFEVSP